jgi:hypothetical protein
MRNANLPGSVALIEAEFHDRHLDPKGKLGLDDFFLKLCRT